MSYSSEHHRLRPVLEKARKLDIASHPAPNALFEPLSAGFNIWCTPEDHPSGWENVRMDAGSFSKPCEYVGTVTWGWEGEHITHLDLATDAYGLRERDKENYTDYHNRPEDVEWASAKAVWLFGLANVPCPPIRG